MKNIFYLARVELKREGLLNSKNYWELLLDRAIYIRHWLDISARNKKVAENRWKNKTCSGII